MTSTAFVERRKSNNPDNPVIERRQFSNSHAELSPPAQELAQAIDQYKLQNRRRFITYEEMFEIISELGYKRD